MKKNNIFVYSTRRLLSPKSINFLKNNINTNDNITIINTELQYNLIETLTKEGYNINLRTSLYSKLGPVGEEVIYHTILSKMDKAIFLLGYDDIMPRSMSIAAEYLDKDNILFNII